MSEPRYLCSTAALHEMLSSPSIGEDRKGVIRQEIEDRKPHAERITSVVQVQQMQDELEYRVRTAAALAKGGHDVDAEVHKGRARIGEIAAARSSARPFATLPRYVATFDSLHPLRGVVIDEQADRYCTFPTLERAQRAAEGWNQPPLIEFDPPMIWRSVVTGRRIEVGIGCDYCGDVLPSVASRSHIPTTPDLQRLGFAADKIVCPECVSTSGGGDVEGETTNHEIRRDDAQR